jgi:hypothetical protein
VASDAIAERAGIDLSAFARHETTIRGRAGMLVVRAVPLASELPG